MNSPIEETNRFTSEINYSIEEIATFTSEIKLFFRENQ